MADAMADEESIAEFDRRQIANSPDVDIDLYLQDGVYFELYSVVCFPDIHGNPLMDHTAIEEELSELVRTGVWFDEIAVDEDNHLILILSQRHQPVLYIIAGGWLVDGWEELPEQS